MKKAWISGPYLVWMIAFILLPLLMIVYYGFTSGDGDFTMANVLAIGDGVHLKALGLSIGIALISTIFCLAIAFPLALVLNSLKIKSNGFVIFVFILPMWMNSLLRTMAWQMILSNNGVLNNMIKLIGLPTLAIANTNLAIIIGMVYDFLPFMILPVYNAVTKIDDDLLHAARDLGANYWQVLGKVVVPLSMPGIISGIIMVFIPAMTSFVISDLLGGGKILLIGNIIEQEFTQTANWHLGSGLSCVLMVFVVVSMMFTQNATSDKESGVKRQ